MASRWLIVVFALFFIGALHTSHVAAAEQPGVTVAAMTLLSPAVEGAHAIGNSDVAWPATAAHHHDGSRQSDPMAGTCLLLLTAAVGGILIVALGRVFARTPTSGRITVPWRRPRRISASLTQLCVQRT